MVSKPLIYCCVPRAGIMIMTFCYGLTGCLPLFVFGCLMMLSEKQFEFIKNVLGDVEPDSFDYFRVLAQIFIGFAYLYTCYLVYKRKYRPIMTLLYILMVDILLDMYSASAAAYNLVYDHPTGQKKAIATSEKLEVTSQEQNVTIIGDIQNAGITRSVISPVGTFLFLVFWVLPLLNKVYVIMKIRSYARYVEYKKDEAKLSSTSMESPYRHPEIEKDD